MHTDIMGEVMMSLCIGLKPFKDVERDLSALESEVYNILNFAHMERDLTQ
jgi:hypothetical protein